jgi:hypothetical protein
MKQLLITLLFATATLAATTAQTIEKRNVGTFDKLIVSGAFMSVTIKQGDTEGVTIESTGIEADKIKTEVKDGALEVSMKFEYGATKGVNLVVTYKKLQSLILDGSANVSIPKPIKSETFECVASGSGNITLPLEVTTLNLVMSGSGNMTLNGAAQVQNIVLNGSGNVEAKKLKGTAANVVVAGSGNVHVHPSIKTTSTVIGTGNVGN